MYTAKQLVSDIAIFVLKRDVKLQLTNQLTNIALRLWQNAFECSFHIIGQFCKKYFKMTKMLIVLILHDWRSQFLIDWMTLSFRLNQVLNLPNFGFNFGLKLYLRGNFGFKLGFKPKLKPNVLSLYIYMLIRF